MADTNFPDRTARQSRAEQRWRLQLTGRMIQQARLKAGCATQQEFANRLGCSLDKISSIESGRYDQTLKSFRELCYKLQLRMDDVEAATRADKICAAVLSNDPAAVTAAFSSSITEAEWTWLLIAFSQDKDKPSKSNKRPPWRFSPAEIIRARKVLRAAFDQAGARPAEAHDFALMNLAYWLGRLGTARDVDQLSYLLAKLGDPSVIRRSAILGLCLLAPEGTTVECDHLRDVQWRTWKDYLPRVAEEPSELETDLGFRVLFAREDWAYSLDPTAVNGITLPDYHRAAQTPGGATLKYLATSFRDSRFHELNILTLAAWLPRANPEGLRRFAEDQEIRKDIGTGLSALYQHPSAPAAIWRPAARIVGQALASSE